MGTRCGKRAKTYTAPTSTRVCDGFLLIAEVGGELNSAFLTRVAIEPPPVCYPGYLFSR